METIPTVMAARVLRGSKAYTTKTMNRKKGTWGQCTPKVNMAQDHVGGEVLSLSAPGTSQPWDLSSLPYMLRQRNRHTAGQKDLRCLAHRLNTESLCH